MPTIDPIINHQSFKIIGKDNLEHYLTKCVNAPTASSRKLYLRNVKLVREMLSEMGWSFQSFGEMFYMFRVSGFFNLVLDTLKIKITNENTLKGRYNCLIKVNQFLKEKYKHQLETNFYQKNLQTLAVKLQDITVEINKKVLQRKKNAKELANMCELEKLQKNVNECKSLETPSGTTIQLLQEKLLIHLYTFLPSRRGEYNKMLVPSPDELETAGTCGALYFTSNNYYDMSSNTFYINKQKNKKKSVIKGTEEIQKMIKSAFYCGYTKKDIVDIAGNVVQKGGTSLYKYLFDLSQSHYSKYVKKIFKKHIGLALTTTMLRKMWVIYSQKQSAEKQIELCSQMGHSLAVAKTHYNKVA